MCGLLHVQVSDVRVACVVWCVAGVDAVPATQMHTESKAVTLAVDDKGHGYLNVGVDVTLFHVDNDWENMHDLQFCLFDYGIDETCARMVKDKDTETALLSRARDIRRQESRKLSRTASIAAAGGFGNQQNLTPRTAASPRGGGLLSPTPTSTVPVPPIPMLSVRLPQDAVSSPQNKPSAPTSERCVALVLFSAHWLSSW
jgi:hypothetical protein